MGSKLMPNDYSLLERALSLASRNAQTLESLSSALGSSIEDVSLYWFAVNSLRRSQGRFLPVPLDTLSGGAENEGIVQSHSGGWYFPTWHLNSLLEEFQINEGLAVHYEWILTEPEGGHYELNLAAGEVVLAVQLEGEDVDAAQMKRICVRACEPTNGIELLVWNAGRILVEIEAYRNEPITPQFFESLYAKLTEGIVVKEACEDGADEVASAELRTKALESFCMHLWPKNGGIAKACDRDYCSEPESHENGFDRGCSCCDGHALINALVALHYFKTFRLFPAGNNVFAYLMYFLVLHRKGYHFSAHVPVMKLLYLHDKAENRKYCLPCEPEDLAVECDGYHDWTRFFERAVGLLVNEQRWTMAKLDGMSRRRERFRDIIDADESMNFRQKEVLLEAVLHSNAEFTYAIHERRYDVSYLCARSDFARLLDMGLLNQHGDGTRHFFFASDDFTPLFIGYLKKHCAKTFFRYYDEDGSLRDEYRSAEETAMEYNKNVGFYEKSLLDKTYVEHYDFRRTPIADNDGPRRRKRPDG